MLPQVSTNSAHLNATPLSATTGSNVEVVHAPSSLAVVPQRWPVPDPSVGSPASMRVRRDQSSALDTAQLVCQELLLSQWLSTLDLQTIDAMARKFHVLQVREQHIVRFTSTSPRNAAIVVPANENLAPSQANVAVHQAADRGAGRAISDWFANPANLARSVVDDMTVMCPTGEARFSPTFELSDQFAYILHAVGPKLGEGASPTRAQEADLHAACRRSFDLARTLRVREMAMSPIATDYPPAESARVLLQAALQELAHPLSHLERLQLSAFDPHGPAQGYDAMAKMWKVAKNVLKECRTQSELMLETPPRSLARHARVTMPHSSRDEHGRYATQLPHMQHAVVTYHPPGSGYFHIRQRGHNCSMHVHDGLSMFYSGHDLRHLASTGDIDSYITRLAQSDLHDPNPGRRTALYSFFDLARYSQQAGGGAPSFDAAHGAIAMADANAGWPNFAWWGATPNIDQAPAIGVTMQVRSSYGQVLCHSVQLIELQAWPRLFVEVDSRRDPNQPDTQPRVIRADTMSLALTALLPHAAQGTIGDYTFDVYYPTPQTLAAWRSRGLALPLPPLPVSQTPAPRDEQTAMPSALRSPAPSSEVPIWSSSQAGGNPMLQLSRRRRRRDEGPYFRSVHIRPDRSPVYQSTGKVTLYAEDHRGVMEWARRERLDVSADDLCLYGQFLLFLESGPEGSEHVNTIVKFRLLDHEKRRAIVDLAISKGLRSHLRTAINRLEGLGLKANEYKARTSAFALSEERNRRAVESIPDQHPALHRNDRNAYRHVLVHLETTRVKTIDRFRQLPQTERDALLVGFARTGSTGKNSVPDSSALSCCSIRRAAISINSRQSCRSPC
ncbi:MAG TPA: macro domain-containing protein [Albitalea sp.]|uniref:macro domain-containing protein n=1 Tax=Piscinibacter sp. TaxID=1903157 RepID=UPI002ED36036